MEKVINLIEILDIIMNEKLEKFDYFDKKTIDFEQYIYDLIVGDKYKNENISKYKNYLILNIYSTTFSYLFENNSDKTEILGISNKTINKIKEILLDKKYKLNDLIQMFETSPIFSKILIKIYYSANLSIELQQEKRIMNLSKTNKLNNLIRLNPLIINQIIDLQNKKISKEEEIINFILEKYNEFFFESDPFKNIKISESQKNQLNFIEEDDYDYENIENEFGDEDIEFYNILKYLLIKEYKEDIKNVILYIVSNVYENIKIEDFDEEYFPEKIEIIDLLENKKTTQEEIVEKFIKDNLFYCEIISTFLDFNLNIKRKDLKKIRNEIKKIGAFSIVKKYNHYTK